MRGKQNVKRALEMWRRHLRARAQIPFNIVFIYCDSHTSIACPPRVLCRVYQSHKAAIVRGGVLEVACGDYHSRSCYWQAMFITQPCCFPPLRHPVFTNKEDFYAVYIYNMFTFEQYLRKTTESYYKEKLNLQPFWPIHFPLNNKVLLEVILGQVCLPGKCASFFNQSGQDEKITGAKSRFWGAKTGRRSTGTETGRRTEKSSVLSLLIVYDAFASP